MVLWLRDQGSGLLEGVRKEFEKQDDKKYHFVKNNSRLHNYLNTLVLAFTRRVGLGRVRVKVLTFPN